MSEERESPWYSLAFEKRAKKKIRSFKAPAPLAPLADTHAHLTCFWTKDPADALGRAALAGVRQLTTLWDPLGDRRDLATFQAQLHGWIAGARERLERVAAECAAFEGAALSGAGPAFSSAASALFVPASAASPLASAWYRFGPLNGQNRVVNGSKRYLRGEGEGSAGTEAESEAEKESAAEPGVDESPFFAETAGSPLTLFDNVRFLAGVHPYGAPNYTDAVHAQVLAALDDPLCAGIGEIGLDYHFDYDDDVAPAPHDVQIACMARQLEVAVARNLPVELHLRNADGDEAREAHADAYRVLSATGLPAAGCVLHCFGEDRATMERFMELGCHIAYGGAATFKRNEAVREAFAATPANRILFETDCPYMAPEPLRGIECEPALIAFTVDALSRDRAARTGEDPAEIQLAAWENARRLLGR